MPSAARSMSSSPARRASRSRKSQHWPPRRPSRSGCNPAGSIWTAPASGLRSSGSPGFMTSLPGDIDAALALLGEGDYVADRSLATAVFLALKLGRPLFLEGEAGVGKTEIAKVLATTLGRNLVRLQCYEGLDIAAAVYEWNYARQMIEIRLAEAAHEASKEKIAADIFSERFLI